ncbi:Fpg/Nei family DNA glycosylase [Egibacter rhizosphaerae]|uniref:Fpg/Nei family DNA glycosylase n=1 Tax=Egibacter rhizosphaerae TaxID=1670831 RepID=A0A411YJ97_9ACTN|nr:DNA-formamidopyrimidine glycosylase family protein [Egibacter rhizosphaerae]QBI21146.1 Fpg/Nei family DNA glycosylase [Egibacter rhizosphaerae]
MPELPELQAHAERLTSRVGGATLRAVEPLSFTALKTVTPSPDAAVGEPLDRVARRGKYLLLLHPSAVAVVHLMQGGRLRVGGSTARRPKGGLVRWRFDDAPQLLLTEPGTERRAGVWVLPPEAVMAEEVEPLAGLGPDADAMTVEELGARLRARRARVHTALRDQSVVAGVGRRLANEVCHRAGCSPFAGTANLDASMVDRLHTALEEVIAEGLAEERARDDFGRAADRTSAVHGRTGEPCPVCGDVVREVAYRAYTVHYCAGCQTGGKVLADNTYSRLGIDRDPGETAPG